MNTPAHSILNLAILGRAQPPQLTWPILLGSWLPDAALFLFYGWAKWARIPEPQIWQEVYYDPTWQDIFAIGNSIPLALMGLGIFIWHRRPGGTAFFASMLLHQFADLPLHHEDAHRHFWPLTSYRFISPISYWDPDHFGRYGALAEVGLLAIASTILWKRLSSIWGKGLVGLINVAYLYGYYRFYLQTDW
jgi:hypothetical protein